MPPCWVHICLFYFDWTIAQIWKEHSEKLAAKTGKPPSQLAMNRGGGIFDLLRFTLRFGIFLSLVNIIQLSWRVFMRHFALCMILLPSVRFPEDFRIKQQELELLHKAQPMHEKHPTSLWEMSLRGRVFSAVVDFPCLYVFLSVRVSRWPCLSVSP